MALQIVISIHSILSAWPTKCEAMMCCTAWRYVPEADTQLSGIAVYT